MGCCESITFENIQFQETCIVNITKKCEYEPIVSKLSILIFNQIGTQPYVSITSVCLAAKFLCDETISLSALADLVGISKKDLEDRESNILKTINWNLWKYTKLII